MSESPTDEFLAPMESEPGLVLVVEDDASAQKFLTDVLQVGGFRSLGVGSIAEAEQCLTDERVEVICALLDEKLPDGRGSDLLRRLRVWPGYETLPVLVITGSVEPADEIIGLEAGATDYLAKPVEPEALLARVGSRIRDRSAWIGLVDSAAASGHTDPRARREGHDRISEIIDDHAFHPVFQPIIRLDDGVVFGYEALTRFADGTPPDARFGLAFEVGLGPELELATLEAAIDTGVDLPDGHRFVSLNVTPGLLAHRAEAVTKLLATTPRRSILELTEREAIDDYDVVREAVAAMGPTVGLSIDDAGAGFASLRHVVMLEPEFVKLDRSWIASIDRQFTLQAMVAGLVHFADNTGCKLIAEGIETEAEHRTLVDLGVVYGQGYRFGRPEPLDR